MQYLKDFFMDFVSDVSALSVHSLEIFINIGTSLGDVGGVNICQSGMIFGRFFGLAHQLFPDLH